MKNLLLSAFLMIAAPFATADIIWSMFVGTNQGEFVTPGDYDTVANYNIPGYVQLDILSFQFTGVTHPNHSPSVDLPIGDVWSHSGGTIGINYDFNNKLTFAVDFEAWTDIEIDLDFGNGVSLIQRQTQKLKIKNYIAHQGDATSYKALGNCAKETREFIALGITPYGCDDFSYRSQAGFGVSPTNPVGLASAVPEPGTLALFGLAALGLLRRRR